MDNQLKTVTLEDEKKLNDVIEDTPEEVLFMGKKHLIRWMKNGTLRKLTNLYHAEKDERKLTTKSVALILLNNYWKIRLWYPILWRYLFYVREVDENELSSVIDACKKKLPVQSYYINTILLGAIRDTTMTMTRKEADNIRLAAQSEDGQV